MDITPLIPKDRQVINRYGDGGFVINGTVYKGNIILLSSGIFPWAIKDIAAINEAAFAPLFTGEIPEILLIGTGIHSKPLHLTLRNYLRDKGIATDVMDTGAACRTYSVLLSEGRQISAALIAV